jgi:hypothetical protein
MMFRNCDECHQWAQWRGTVKEAGIIKLIRHLCQKHKDADKTPLIKFVFCGIVPIKKES